MSRRRTVEDLNMKRPDLIIEVRTAAICHHDDDGTVVVGVPPWVERLPQPLRHPEDVRANSRRDRYERVVLTTDDEAAAYGASLIEAFNAHRPRSPDAPESGVGSGVRELVSARLAAASASPCPGWDDLPLNMQPTAGDYVTMCRARATPGLGVRVCCALYKRTRTRLQKVGDAHDGMDSRLDRERIERDGWEHAAGWGETEADAVAALRHQTETALALADIRVRFMRETLDDCNPSLWGDDREE